MSDRVGAQSASEPQCCGTPKFKQTNYLLHVLELSEGFSLSSVRGVKKKQVLGMLSPFYVPITPALPECPSVGV